MLKSIAVYEGKRQLYGTQFDWNENGELSARAFDALDKVNHRRKLRGLITLEEDIEIIRSPAKNENQSAPGDLEKRKKEFDEWKKRWVGQNSRENEINI